MDLYLQGKKAIVSGASQGMGRAITKELAAEGVKVLAIGRNAALLESLREEIIATGNIEPLMLAQDLLEPDAPVLIAATALDKLGQVDILINNAGKSRPMDVMGDEKEWEESMLLDFIRHRQLTQALLPHMMERRQGSILNIISTYELRTMNASAVAKASITVWAKQLAGELGKYGIRVNCIQPGLIDTQNIRPFFPGEERKKFAEKEIPLGEFGEPEDIANMAIFLVSQRASYITGAVTVVDGGLRHHPF